MALYRSRRNLLPCGRDIWMVVEFRPVTKIENILSYRIFIESRYITAVLISPDITGKLVKYVVVPFDGSGALSLDFIIELIKFDCPIKGKLVLSLLHLTFFPLTLPRRIRANLTELKWGLIP